MLACPMVVEVGVQIINSLAVEVHVIMKLSPKSLYVTWKFIL